MLEDQHVSFIIDQLDNQYREEGLDPQSQLGFEHFLLRNKLPTLNHRITTSQVSTLQEGAIRGALEREKGAEALSSLPFLSLNHQIASLGEESVEVVEERVKVSFPLFFPLGVNVPS